MKVLATLFFLGAAFALVPRVPEPLGTTSSAAAGPFTGTAGGQASPTGASGSLSGSGPGGASGSLSGSGPGNAQGCGSGSLAGQSESDCV